MGALKENNLLSNGKKLFEGRISGPESIAEYKGNLFTGSNDGAIYRIEGEKITPVIRIIDNNCAESWNKSLCGR